MLYPRQEIGFVLNSLRSNLRRGLVLLEDCCNIGSLRVWHAKNDVCLTWTGNLEGLGPLTWTSRSHVP